MGFVLDARGEGDIAARHRIKTPKAADLDRRAVLLAQRADEAPRTRIIGIDLAVAKIADQQRSCELIEARWRNGHAPRRIQRAARGNQLLLKFAAFVKH